MGIRECSRPGLRLYDQDSKSYTASLRPDGVWQENHGARYGFEPVEVFAPTLEGLADELQRLRDGGPEVEGTSVLWWAVNSALWQSLDRGWVVELVVFITERDYRASSRFPFGKGPDRQTKTTVGPLPSLRKAFLDWADWFLNRTPDC